MDAQGADQAAIAACLDGDVEAFTPLVERYQEVAFRAAWLIVRDPDIAHDIAQEGFIRAYRNLPRFRRDSSFRPWLLKVVTNLALNELRGQKRQGTLVDRVLPLLNTTAPSASRTLEEVESRDEVRAALNSLPENDRLVLYLRHYLNLPEAEIAEIIGQRPGTVKSRLSRASARLRTVIERDYPALIPNSDHGGLS